MSKMIHTASILLRFALQFLPAVVVMFQMAHAQMCPAGTYTYFIPNTSSPQICSKTTNNPACPSNYTCTESTIKETFICCTPPRAGPDPTKPLPLQCPVGRSPFFANSSLYPCPCCNNAQCPTGYECMFERQVVQPGASYNLGICCSCNITNTTTTASSAANATNATVTCPNGQLAYMKQGENRAYTCTFGQMFQCPSGYACTNSAPTGSSTSRYTCCPFDFGKCQSNQQSPYIPLFATVPLLCVTVLSGQCPTNYRCEFSTTNQPVCCLTTTPRSFFWNPLQNWKNQFSAKKKSLKEIK